MNNPTLNIGLIDYMRGRFPNLVILGDNTNPQFIYRGGNSLYRGAKTVQLPPPLPYFYLDEALVQYASVADISLADVAMIRFMPPPVWFAPYNGGNAGAIMIYTKKPSDEVRKALGLTDNFDHYLFNGFSITREFNAPDYSKQKPAQVKADDNRLTLYWNHDLDTDGNGVLKFRFYNSDRAKKFKVVIQGMDKEGRLVYLQQILQQNLQ